MQLLTNYFYQVFFTIGIVIIFGFIVSFCNKRFYRNFGRYNKTICYITGIIGTPIHEISHVIFCLIFLHRIDEVKLFNIGNDGTLGYVSHSYNPKNIYQKVGNFFIGIAPIIVISLILFISSILLIPDFSNDINGLINNLNNFDISNVLLCIKDIIVSFFSNISITWFIFLFIAINLSIHMTLSPQDIKGSISGGILLLTILFLINLVLYLIDISLVVSLTNICITIGFYLIGIFLISLIVIILALIISFIFKLLNK